MGWIWSRHARAWDSRGSWSFGALQHLDRAAGAGGAGGFAWAYAAAVADREVVAEPALAGGDGAGVAGVAVGDRGVAAGAAVGGAALPGERADRVALARGEEAGGGAGATGVRGGGGHRRRSRGRRLGGPEPDDRPCGHGGERPRPCLPPDPDRGSPRLSPPGQLRRAAGERPRRVP